MAELFEHGRTLRRLIQRWRVVLRSGTRGRISQMPSWISPTIRADRDWDDDEREVWGFTADANTLGEATNRPAVAVFALEKEVQIRRIDFRIVTSDPSIFITGREMVLITPPTGYNPVILNPGQFFPFLQGNPAIPGQFTSIISIPRAVVIGGHNTGLMTITIDGVLIDPAIGPRYVARHDNVVSNFGDIVMENVLDWNDPPLILPPFRVFAMQFINPSNSVEPDSEILLVNIYFSEREIA